MVGQTAGRGFAHPTPFVRDQRRAVRRAARGAPADQPRYQRADAQTNPGQVLQRDEAGSGNVPVCVPTLLQLDAGDIRREHDGADVALASVVRIRAIGLLRIRRHAAMGPRRLLVHHGPLGHRHPVSAHYAAPEHKLRARGHEFVGNLRVVWHASFPRRTVRHAVHQVGS